MTELDELLLKLRLDAVEELDGLVLGRMSGA
jgi:hypothetical protein